MKRKMEFIVGALFFVIASCAVITVNIYFPEKDVKEAYKNLEKELMDTDKKIEDKKPEGKSESSIRFEIITSAYAQEKGLADKISETVKKMPDVVNAYKEMGARIADIDRLRDTGAVGEGKDGLLATREKTLPPADKKLIDMENENRKTVMKGMAKAIIRINRLPEKEENLNQVMPQAIEQFAAIRRDAAKKGWWIQDPSGNWTKK
ncbi:MAG: YdbL family protein [Nitrospirota bacterium]|nr:YdbL family protein [Nitrospirota bacterium]MDH5767585.1 YdbL family protein [Nitrospirota bacterium]